MILVLVVFLGLGCSKSDDSGSSASNMKLSDLSSNLKGNSLFVTVGNSQSVSIRSSYTSKRSSNGSNTNTNSLIVSSDNNSNYDYGLISNYEIEIEQVIVDHTNTFAYLPLKYNGGHSDLSYDKNVRAINCTILKFN